MWEIEIDTDGEDQETEALVKSTATHMFGKTLTDIDANNYGGFLVPRQGAEDCFPPLVIMNYDALISLLKAIVIKCFSVCSNLLYDPILIC